MPHPAKLLRLLVLITLAAAIVTASVFLFTTDRGQQILSNPHQAGRDAQQWVAHHRVIAPAVFMVFYVVLILLMLPVWWMQILAGYGFGLILGVLWSQIAATIGSVLAML